MNNIQEHLVKLLGEVDELCTANRIPYVLYGRTARDACSEGRFIGDYVSAGVMIPAESFEKFESLVAAKYHGARAVEWLANNPDFPGLSMRYVDTDTTFIYGDSVQRYKYPGIFVTIERVREIPAGRIKAKLANGIDKVLAYSTVADLSSLSAPKRAAVRLFKGFAKLFGREKTLRRLLRFQCRLARKHGNKMAIIHCLQNNTDLSRAYLSKIKRVVFENRSFFVPSDHKPYLNIVFGKTWPQNLPAEIPSPHLLVSSTEVSFRDVLAADDRDSLKQVNAVIAERNRILDEMKPLETRINGFWDHLFLTKARFDLFRKYYPHRKELADYLEKKDFPVLADLAEELMALETEYLDKGLVMPVFKELDQIVYGLYIFNGDYTHADQFKKRLSGFSGTELPLDADLSGQDPDFWPRYLRADADGFVPAFASAPDGRRCRIAYKTYTNRVFNLLTLGEEGLTLASPEDAALVAFDGETELPFAEALRLCAEGGACFFLFQEDAMGRGLELGALTADGEFFQTAQLNGRRWLGASPLPLKYAVNEDGSLDCRLFCGEEDEGRVFWLCEGGRELPLLEAVPGGIAIRSPFDWTKPSGDGNAFDLAACLKALEAVAVGKTPAVLMCEGPDGKPTGLRERLAALSETCSADPEDGSPFSLRGRDIFGRELTLAAVTEDLQIVPAAVSPEDDGPVPSDK